jgi:hypothetical protein
VRPSRDNRDGGANRSIARAEARPPCLPMLRKPRVLHMPSAQPETFPAIGMQTVVVWVARIAAMRRHSLVSRRRAVTKKGRGDDGTRSSDPEPEIVS